jgi:hypothetical protein
MPMTLNPNLGRPSPAMLSLSKGDAKRGGAGLLGRSNWVQAHSSSTAGGALVASGAG